MQGKISQLQKRRDAIWVRWDRSTYLKVWRVHDDVGRSCEILRELLDDRIRLVVGSDDETEEESRKEKGREAKRVSRKARSSEGKKSEEKGGS